LVAGGGRTIKEAAELALQFAESPPSEIPPVAGEVFSDGKLIPSLTVTGRYTKGESILANTIGGGAELLDAFGQLHQDNPVLATIGLVGVSAVLGGPTRTILKRLAGDAGDNLIERGAEVFGGFIGRIVTNIALKNKFTVVLTIAGYSAEADATILGPVAGTIASAGVETALGAGVGQALDRVQDVRRSFLDTLKLRRRTLELGQDPDRLLIREGIGGTRFEQATGRTIKRDTDGATDFIDRKLGKFDLKGPLRENDGSPIPIGPENVEGLARSVVKEANRSTASKAVVVDTLGLSREQIDFVKSEVAKGATKDKPVIFLEGK
jgi:hypothetical protein